MTVMQIDARTQRIPRLPLSTIAHQKTLAASFALRGTGLHSGGETVVTVHPAAESSGIVFTNGSARVAARPHNVVDTSRGTTIGFNGDRFRTIEHLMAALRGCGVDNALVEVSGEEAPALDGSARPIVDAIRKAGVRAQDAQREPVELTEPVCVRQNGSFIVAVPADSMKITYVLSYDHPLIGSQTAWYEFSEEDFADEMAPARTFVLYEEVAALLENRLARGGSLDNAIVIWQDRLSSELRFPDELVRHKVVDLVGDLALLGGVLHAEVLAVKSGHALNVEFASQVERQAASRPLLEAVV